jgi:uncharacterized membrane protein YjfL (UPF0719 family)
MQSADENFIKIVKIRSSLANQVLVILLSIYDYVYMRCQLTQRTPAQAALLQSHSLLGTALVLLAGIEHSVVRPDFTNLPNRPFLKKFAKKND